MISDTERREVARKLRAARGPSLMVLMGVLGVGGAHLFDRLADLIEPGESGQNRDSVPKESPAVQKAPECDREATETCEHWLDGECYELRTVRPVDRGALLALADEMSMDGMDGLLIPMSEYARRIREAMGVDA